MMFNLFRQKIKGECQEIFTSVFFMINLLQVPWLSCQRHFEFFEHSHRYSHIKVHHPPVINLTPAVQLGANWIVRGSGNDGSWKKKSVAKIRELKPSLKGIDQWEKKWVKFGIIRLISL